MSREHRPIRLPVPEHLSVLGGVDAHPSVDDAPAAVLADRVAVDVSDVHHQIVAGALFVRTEVMCSAIDFTVCTFTVHLEKALSKHVRGAGKAIHDLDDAFELAMTVQVARPLSRLLYAHGGVYCEDTEQAADVAMVYRRCITAAEGFQLEVWRGVSKIHNC